MRYKAIVFDAYGTLFDVQGIDKTAESLFPGYGAEIAKIWREKQIEYTRLISLGDPDPSGSRYYDSFWNITRQSLRYTLKRLGLTCGIEPEVKLMGQYSRLELYPSVKDVLASLRQLRIPLGILSNANHEMLLSAVHCAGISGQIQSLISIDAVRHFKTSPLSYGLVLKHFPYSHNNILFVSSNSWDIVGAGWYGFGTFWLNRHDHPIETIGLPPTHVGKEFGDILKIIQHH